MNSNDQTPFDWSLVDKLNPEAIVKQSEVKLVRSFVKMLLNTDFQGLTQSSFQSRDISKLLLLFQATITLLYNSQKQYQIMCKERTKKYTEAVEEITKLKHNEKNLQKLLHTSKKVQMQAEVCPLCKKKFKNLDYLNKHIKSKHNEHFHAWESLHQTTDPQANIQDNNEQNNNFNGYKENQQTRREIQLKFVTCNSITIDSSIPHKKKIEQRPFFELDEDVPQQNDDDVFVINNYIKNQIPPIQKAHNKTPRSNNSFENNQQHAIQNDNNIHQIGLDINPTRIDADMTSNQINDMANRAASNIINDMKIIAEVHKKHYSTPQTPKEKQPRRDKNTSPNQAQDMPLQSNTYNAKAQTPDTSKRNKPAIIPSDGQIQAPHQRKERQYHQQQLQQSIQQQPQQNPQELYHKQGKRPQTPPAISSRKKQQDDESNRPSTAESVSMEIHHHQHHQQHKYQHEQNQQQQQQIQPQQQQSQQIQQKQQKQQQPQQIQKKQHQKQQEVSKFENEENASDPFIIDNEEDNENHHEQNNSKHVIIITPQLDKKPDHEEAENQSQSPKKKRKKHKKATQMQEEANQANNESNATNKEHSNNNDKDAKFNFKETKNDNPQNAEQINIINDSQSKSKNKKKNVTFINVEDNRIDSKSNQQQQQQPRKEEVKIGIVKRVDINPYVSFDYDEYNIQLAREYKSSKNEPKTVKRMGGFDIPNSELDALMGSSQSNEYEYN